MEFLLSDIHDDLASSIDALLTKADIASVARAWAGGDTAPGTAVIAALAETGVAGLLIDDALGGAGAGAVEMVVAFEQLGRHAVPGPLVESFAVVPVLLRGTGSDDRLGEIAEGALSTVAIAPCQPSAADAAVAGERYLVSGGVLTTATAGDARASVDPTRTLSPLTADRPIAEGIDDIAAADIGSLATAAYLLGLGLAQLAIASEYAQSRKQFGKAIGSFQAVKHHLADVAIAIEMARPLVHGAALGVDGQVPEGTHVSRDISAAKVAAADAAYLASRQSLQVLGAIGYTAEHDLSLFLTKTRALVGAWGTPAAHRQRILETL